MSVSDPPYDRVFFENQATESARSAATVTPLVMAVLNPTRVVDVGCGVGAWAAAFRAAGATRVVGIDGDYVDRSLLLIPKEDFLPMDLEADWRVDEQFDLVVSLEVGEHLLEQAAEAFVQRLCRLADAVLFSAAIPNQGGNDHRNEQWPTYWARRFDACGFACFDMIRSRVWSNPAVDVWYKQNTLLYCRKGSKAYESVTASCDPVSADAVMSFVHPELFERRVGPRSGLGDLIRALPSAVTRAIEFRLRRGRRA